MAIHPLFPDKDCEISWILLTRHEAQGQVFHPNRWDPEELQDLNPIQELFGGGVYELIARDERGIVARQKYKLAGASKPLVPEPERAAAPPAAPVIVSGGSPGDAILQAVLALIPAMLQSQAAQQAGMVAMFQAQATQQQQFLTAMMTASKQDSNALIQAMAELAKSQTATMAEAMRSQGGSAKGGDEVIELLTTGMELGSKMAEKPNEMSETISAVVEGIGALRQSGPPKSTNGAG